MKHKLLLCLLIILQLCSCNKRYAHLKKIRVSHKGKAESVKIEKRTQETTEINSLETAGMDSIIILTESPQFRIHSKKPGEYKQVPPIQLHRKNVVKSQQLKPSLKKQQPTPDKQDGNQNALLAFIFTLGALAFIPLLFVSPIIAILAVLILASLARYYGEESYIKLKGKKDTRKWMALTSMIVGTILTAFALIALIISIPYTLFYGSLDEGAIILITLFGSILATIMLVIDFFVVDMKYEKSIVPEKQTAPQPLAGTNKYASLALSLWVAAFIFLLLAIIFPPLAILTILCFLGALITGIVALNQIQSTQQDGKWMAIIAVFFIPAIIVLFNPFLLLAVAIAFVIWWVRKRNKRKKSTSAPSS